MQSNSNDQRKEIVRTSTVILEGNLFKLSDITIHIRNISMITVSDAKKEWPPFPGIRFALALTTCVVFASDNRTAMISFAALFMALVLLIGWLIEAVKTKNSAYLNLILNSGFVYSIYFRDKDFLRVFQDKFNEVFASGGREGVYYNFNLDRCTFTDRASVMRK